LTTRRTTPGKLSDVLVPEANTGNHPPGRFQWVQNPETLHRLADNLTRVREFSLDSESNSGFAYEERLCLLQMNVADQLWLIDLLALTPESGALECLREPFENPQIRVFLHGGEFDVGCLKRDCGISLRGVWDSQQAASFLGWEKTGYGAVVDRVLDVQLPKNHAHYDWSRRPIEGEVLQYALNDVRYLPEVCHHLQQEVEDADLVEEVDLAFRAVETATWNGGYHETGFWSLKGIGKVAPKDRPMLFSLYRWRNTLARRLDLPAGRALNTQVLLALARNPPANVSDLKRLGVPARVSREWDEELLEVVTGAKENPPVLPQRPSRTVLTKPQQARGDRLKRWRRKEAERREVPLQVVLPLEALKCLQREGAKSLDRVPQLGGKRIRLYRAQLEELCSR